MIRLLPNSFGMIGTFLERGREKWGGGGGGGRRVFGRVLLKMEVLPNSFGMIRKFMN